MKPKIEKLKEEINKLRAKKEAQLELTKNFQEKNKLIQEINLLKRAGKKPSIFGRNFSKGLNLLSKGIEKGFKGIQKASRNLDEKKKRANKSQPRKDITHKEITSKKNANPWEFP